MEFGGIHLWDINQGLTAASKRFASFSCARFFIVKKVGLWWSIKIGTPAMFCSLRSAINRIVKWCMQFNRNYREHSTLVLPMYWSTFVSKPFKLDKGY